MDKINKQVIITVVIVIIISLGIWQYDAYRKDAFSKLPITEQIKQTDNIKSFSLNGVVVKIDGEKITLRTGEVRKTPDGEQFVGSEKTIITNSETTYIFSDKSPSAFTSVKTGQKIEVATNQNPFELSELTAITITLTK